MIRTKALIAFAAVGMVAGAAHADGPLPALPLPLYGSDTLFDVTRDIIASPTCGVSANLSYKGTGSSQGGKAMGPGDSTVVPAIPKFNQQVAPQSRFLNAAECSAVSTNAGNGITIGLDGIAVVADNQPAQNSCETLRYDDAHNPVAIAGYTFSDWRDVLRVVYTGQTSKITIDPCSPSDPARTPSAPGNIIGRCDSQIRKDLVSNWSNLFEASCTNGKCGSGLRHAWRRDDASGTTDTFLTLLGLPAATTHTFCGGFDNEDIDPIRRPCDANEQVCSNTKYARRGANPEGGAPPSPAKGLESASDTADLGLVLAVTMPTDTAQQFAQALCPTPLGGAFRRAPMRFAVTAEEQRCPDGTAQRFGTCLWPSVSTTGPFCLARKGNIPGVRHPDFQFMDGRGYNQTPRNSTTGAILLPSTAGQIPDPRWGGGGFYKIHQTAPIANGVGTCTQNDATRQIGCLVQADPCSIGYAGREAVSATAKALNLRSPLSDAAHAPKEVDPTVPAITLLLDPSGQASPGNLCGKTAAVPDGSNSDFGYRYPLARRLWINSSKGLANVTDNVTASDGSTLNTKEKQFVTCLQDRSNSVTDNAVAAHGFITLPAGAYPAKGCP